MTTKTITVGLVLLVLCGAVLLTPGVQAQQRPAQAITGDYNVSPLTRSNPSYGVHQSVTGAHYGPAVAFNDNNEAAFLADFLDPRTGPVRGIFTSAGRKIAEDGARIGDITVLQIRATEPFDLQLNRRSEVAWIALIEAPECGQRSTCLGLFVNSKLTAMTLAPAPSAYILGDNGKITAPADHYWITPAAGGIVSKASGEAVGTVAGSVAKSVWGQIRNTTRIPGGKFGVPWSKDPITVGFPNGNPLPVPGAPATPGLPGQPGPAAAQTRALFEVIPQLPYCAATPGGSWPSAWSRNANAAGPIAGQRLEWPGDVNSAFHPQVHRWMKKTYFSPDCREIMVAAIECPGVTQEVWTAAGMLVSFDAADAVYRLNGIPPVALPSASIPIEDGIRINRRCAVLAVVSFKHATDDESALVIGTPAKGGHCPTE